MSVRDLVLTLGLPCAGWVQNLHGSWLLVGEITSPTVPQGNCHEYNNFVVVCDKFAEMRWLGGRCMQTQAASR
jgi:hypothetical protein